MSGNDTSKPTLNLFPYFTHDATKTPVVPAIWNALTRAYIQTDS